MLPSFMRVTYKQKKHEKTKKTWIQVKEVGFMEVDYSFVKPQTYDMSNRMH